MVGRPVSLPVCDLIAAKQLGFPETVFRARPDRPYRNRSFAARQLDVSYADLRTPAARAQFLLRLSLRTHPDKTFIGRIAKGFDFLGYHFFNSALSAAVKTVTKMYETAARLYEQKRRGDSTAPLEKYVTRWNAWFRGGLGDLNLCSPHLPLTQTEKGYETSQEKR